MKIIREESELPKRRRRVVLTIGVFDGFHKGHRLILDTVLKEAEIISAASLLITFDVHPRLVNGHEFDGYITERGKKISLLKDTGLTYIWYLRFARLNRLSPEKFLEYVQKYFQIEKIVIGEGFRFGRDASGCASFLSVSGFKVKELKRLSVDRHPVSSSAIRDLIVKGDFALIKKLLGRSYSINSKVVHGKGRGRTDLDVPTANLELHEKVIPPLGVYITKVKYGSKEYPAITNLGYAPTMRANAKKQLCLETFLLDFRQNIYGKDIEVIFLKFLRPEKIFPDMISLKLQIQKDIRLARDFFRQERIAHSGTDARA